MKKILTLVLFALMGVASAQGSGLLPPLVDAKWLNDNLDEDNLYVLDIRDQKEFDQGTIPGALFSDYFKLGWRVKRGDIPGFLPTKEKVQSIIQYLGLEEDSKVVVLYGTVSPTDFGAAARVYWTLKVAGLQNLAILNGGIKAWQDAKFELGKGTSNIPSDYIVESFDESIHAEIDEVKAAIDNESLLILDARPEEQYEGYEKHEASKSGGTIPNSQNLSQFDLLDENGALFSKDKIGEKFASFKVDNYEGVISFCNTGHWAATNWFALSEVLGKKTKLYDGSMVEWTHSGNVLDRTKNRIQLWFYELNKG